jgi:hypothetical protein
MKVEIGRQNIIILFWNNEATLFYVKKAGNHIDLYDLITFVLWRPK